MEHQIQKLELNNEDVLLSVLHNKEKLDKINNTDIFRFKKSILKFHQISCLCQVSPSAKQLYFYILRRMIRGRYAPIFFSNDIQIIDETGFDFEKLQRSRDELINLKLIIYRPGDYGISSKPMYKVEI